MMLRYDDRARLVFHFAREEGDRLGHGMIGPEHLLLGLMRVDGTASRVLGDLGATTDGLRRQVAEALGKGSTPADGETATVAPRAVQAMERAAAESQRLGSPVIATEHILLGILAEEEGAACAILRSLAGDVRQRVLEASATPPSENDLPSDEA